MIPAEGILAEEVLHILPPISEWSRYWWLGVIIIAAGAYLCATCCYWWRSREADDKIHLAPISVKGGISEKLGSREVGLLLRTQFDAIKETFRKATGSNVSDFAAEAVSAEFPSINAALVDVSLKAVSSELRVKEDLVVAIGPVKIPVNAIIDLLCALPRKVPVFFRRRYLASLFHVSVVSVENETQLLVYRKGTQPVAPVSSQPEVLKPSGSRPVGPDTSKQKVMVQSGSRPMLLARSAKIKGITDFNGLLRDAAFMLLQMQGGFEGRYWLGMRYFADGLDALDEYRHTSKDKLLKTAKESFGLAVAADSENYEATYFYGYMLLFERTRESIATATQLFERVVKTEDKKLKALAKTGLAHCYAQQFHRLAKREDNLLAQAGKLAEEAGKLWKEATKKKTVHRLILYTKALSMIADEGKGKPIEEVKKRFLAAACLLLEATKEEPDNAMFFNTLGWLFLKLAQRGIKNVVAQDVKAEDRISAELVGSTAERSEHYTRVALDLYPQNKLSHANLCLLYATPRYLDEEEEGKKDEYLIRCRYHGLKAIQLDPKYINGHRDLAQSLIRYGEFDEAEKYFKKALRFAAVVDKDLEIIEDTMKVLKEIGAGEKWLKRFAHPDPKLLEPPP
jgi:tetratricopeptide (TPR) repeat protein